MTPVRLTVPRRALDVIVAVALLLLLSPLLLFLTVLVYITSGRPTIFCQQRMGEGGHEFTLYKFRTMRPDSTGPSLTSGSDPRVTGPGRLLRRFALDELPQLFNVLRGDMTLVGPRPEPADLARRFPPEYQWMFRHRPGLTGPCQLRSRSHAALLNGMPDPEEYYLTVMVPRRAAMNAELLADITLTTVLHYIARTLWYLLSAAWDRAGGSSDRPGRNAAGRTEEDRSLCVPS
ncbi:sugar transferase [Streptomyces sp. ME02-8801-2C]|uniref:sugar transferase n=1 Tax=Streptomyces sp. ME02-8801-2C TaxID=3028680 RepID=UPI0029B15B39|nr:sugar transferase [Streptomyces sp. ME02-8801-2C]MDX3451819.1 sugar transferase [Streptomyces sp. ME02-8801-2C]